MNITQEEANKIIDIAAKATRDMIEAGAHCAVMLWSREIEQDWLMEWSRNGSPYEALSLARRYVAIDAQDAQANCIANKMNPPDDGEAWKA